MRILVTGGAGFIGSHLVENLLRDGGWRITVIDDLNDFYSPEIKRTNLKALAEAGDFRVLVGDQRRPIEARRRDAPAEARRILEIVAEAAGIDEELLRHTTPDHASAAEAILLGNRHLGGRLVLSAPQRSTRKRARPEHPGSARGP